MDASVILRADGPVAEIRLNRPAALNTFDITTAQEFAEAVANLAAATSVRAVVLSAEGRSFAAGGDVRAFAADFDRSGEVIAAILDALNPAVLTLRALDAPVIAAVRGVAAGAGLSLVLGADLVVAAEGARFVLAYDQVAGVPDCGGSWFLARRLGAGLAAEMMLTGRTLAAPEAQALGLVTRIAPDDGVDAAARSLAAEVAAGPTRAFGAWRRLMDAAATAPLAEQLDAEKAAFVGLAGTADFREGVSAFLERRKPQFRGA